MIKPRSLHYAWIVAGVTFLVLLVGAGIRATPGVLILPLILPCHKYWRSKVRWQHGQRGSVREIARAMAIRKDVIEFGTFRSGRMGGSAGSITFGKGMFFDKRGFAWS